MNKHIKNFLDDLIGILPQEPIFIVARIAIDTQPQLTDDVVVFIKQYVIPYKDMIEERNDKFFIDIVGKHGFDKSTQEKINHFMLLWRSNKLDDDDKEGIWTWVDFFVKYVEETI
jgi:hypothetical protein